MSAHQGYKKLDKLGEGTYGTVYKALDKSTNRIVALKRMVPMSEEEGIPATTIREIMLLKELRHSNIVRLYDVLFQVPKLTLVFEYCDCDLKQYQDKKPEKQLHPTEEILPFMFQLLSGMNYMHARSVVHRDLKPQNLLVTEDKTLKVADFGLGRVEGIPVKKYSHDAVTLWYRSPDIILGSVNYGLAADMWSIGCIFAEMITGEPLFCGRTEQEQLLRIFRFLGTPSETDWPSVSKYPETKTMLSHQAFSRRFANTVDTWCEQHKAVERVGPEGVDLLKRLLQFEPSERMTSIEAIKHPYLSPLQKKFGSSTKLRLPNLMASPGHSPAPSPRRQSPLDGHPPPDDSSSFDVRRVPSFSRSSQSQGIVDGESQEASTSTNQRRSSITAFAPLKPGMQPRSSVSGESGAAPEAMMA